MTKSTNKKETATGSNKKTRAQLLKGTMATSNQEAKTIGLVQNSSINKASNFASKNIGVNVPVSSRTKVLTSVNRLKNFEGVDFATSGIGYVFFTPLDMNLVNHRAGRAELYGFLEYLALSEEGKILISYLDADYYRGVSSTNDPKVNGRLFMNLLTNMSKSFETKDTSLETSTRETFMGYRSSVPTDYTDSISADSFTINYYETRDLYVLKLHKLWVDYMHNVRRGHYIPKDKYIKTRVLDYMSSMYYIVVGEDGMEIKYWAKYTGVYPVNIPYSAMSWHGFENANLKELSVTYNYNYKEDMDISSLIDFAKYSSASNGSSGTVDSSLVRSEYSKSTQQIMREMWSIGLGVAVKNGKYYLIFDSDRVGLKQTNADFKKEIAKGDLKFNKY